MELPITAAQTKLQV